MVRLYRGGQVKRITFYTWRSPKLRPVQLDLFVEQSIKSLVIMGRIMMERDKVLNLSQLCELKSVLNGAVSPSNTAFILFESVLAIVHQ